MKHAKYIGAGLLVAALAALAAVGSRERAPATHARPRSTEARYAEGASGRTRARRGPATSPAASAVTTSAEARDLREGLATASYDVGDGAAERYARFLDGLRANRARSTALLVEALRLMSPEERWGPDARPVVYALGQVGDASALAELSALLDEPLPASAPIDHHNDPRSEALVTRSMALDAMVTIAERDADRRTVASVDDRLRSLVAAPETSAHLVATAAGALRRHADDPAAEVERLEALLGERRAWLAHLEYRTTTPATAEAR